jgi:hypothetical protein
MRNLIETIPALVVCVLPDGFAEFRIETAGACALRSGGLCMNWAGARDH